MDNNLNQQPVYQQVQKQPSNKNIMGLIALICSGVGTLLALIGSILTCTCSASKSWDLERLNEASSVDFHSASAVMVLAIIGAIIALVGLVLGVIDAKKNSNKMAFIAIALGSFGFLYGVLPMLVICGYNCSLDSNLEEFFVVGK